MMTSKKFFFIFFVLFLLKNIILPEKSYAGFDSLIEYETRTNYSSFIDFMTKVIADIYTCLTSIKVAMSITDTCLPRIINSDGSYTNDCMNSKNHAFFPLHPVSIPIIIAMIAAYIASFNPLIWIVAGMVLVDIVTNCLGMYVLAPHEYITFLINDKITCKMHGDRVILSAEKVVTPSDVPFFFNCLDEEVPKDLQATKAELDKHYGNMTNPSFPYCQAGNSQYALNKLEGRSSSILSNAKIDPKTIGIGSIIIGSVSFANIIKTGNRKLCEIDKDQMIHFSMQNVRDAKFYQNGTMYSNNTPNKVDSGKTITFYKFYSGKIILCAASTSFFIPAVLIINGCTHVAPPIQTVEIDPGFTYNTRCNYFLNTREDLQSLGKYLYNADSKDQSPVALYLMSDMHILSTVVGCIQDLLVKTMVGGDASLLVNIQKIMKNIVTVVLILYISLLGIKIISSPNAPQLGEVVTYVLKFGCVVIISGVTGSSIWYNEDGDGLYPLLLKAMDENANSVIQSVNISPVPMCYLNYEGDNLLSERRIIADGHTLKPTAVFSTNGSSSYIHLTIWDYLGCKLVSFFNFNSCNYTMSGMVSTWLVSTCLFFPSSFLLGIIIMAFCVVLIMTIVHFVHIAITSMFGLTILILVSPIMSCFLLFDYTKETFKGWFKMIIGYMIYPALLFAFLSIMIVTFDSIFYGQPIRKECVNTQSCTVADICGSSSADNDSIYCGITRSVYSSDNGYTTDTSKVDPKMCRLENGVLLNSITANVPIKIFGITIAHTRTITEQAYGELLFGALKMLLFSILFYSMTNAVTNFFSLLLSLFTPQEENRGARIGKAAVSGVIASAPLAAKAALMPAKAMKGIVNKLRK